MDANRGGRWLGWAGAGGGANLRPMSNPFRPERWRPVDGFEFTDITYHRAVDVPAVRIAFDRPEVRNAFRPHTVDELLLALEHAGLAGARLYPGSWSEWSRDPRIP